MDAIEIGLVFTAAAFVHTTAGFGAALIAMALLVPMIGLSVAAPLVALISLPLQIMIVWRYSEQFSLTSVRDMLIAILIGTPIGIWGLGWLNEEFLLTVLGGMILVYVAYTAFGRQQLTLDGNRLWMLIFGLTSGILNGAYNAGGPIIVVYYKSRGFPPDEFRANVQTTFIVATLFVIAVHILRGNVTGEVLRDYAVALPGMIIGFGLGILTARFINPRVFHWIVLGLLAVLGLQLLLT